MVKLPVRGRLDDWASSQVVHRTMRQQDKANFSNEENTSDSDIASDHVVLAPSCQNNLPTVPTLRLTCGRHRHAPCTIRFAWTASNRNNGEREATFSASTVVVVAEVAVTRSSGLAGSSEPRPSTAVFEPSFFVAVNISNRVATVRSKAGSMSAHAF
jgi:hypothetical protein